MMKRHRILIIKVCCVFTLVVGCNKNPRQPYEPSDSDGIPTVHEVLVVNVEEEILPPPRQPKPAVEAPPAPKKKSTPAPKPAAKPAPKPAPKKVATARPKKVNPLKAALDKKDVLAVAGDTPRRTKTKKKPAPKPKPKPAAKPKDKSPSEEEDEKKDEPKADDILAPEVKAVQETVVAFARAVEKADAKAFKEHLAYSKADKPMLDVMWSMTKEMNGFEKDMKKAYGQAGVEAVKKSQLARTGMAPPSVDDIKDKMAVKVTGNKAKVTIPGQSKPMNVVKVDGKWKVQLFKPGQFRGPQATIMAGVMKSMVGGVKNARKKIGKPGYTPKKIMDMVNTSMAPGAGMAPKNMKLPRGMKMPKRGK